MNTFKLKPEGFKAIRKKMLVSSIPLGLIAVFVGLFISSDKLNSDTIPLVIPISLFALGIGFFFSIKKQKELWNTYELIIEEDKIIRHQKSVPSVTIKKEEITEIIKTSEGHLLIKTADRLNFINIPSFIESQSTIIELLDKFGEIKVKKNKKVINLLIFILPVMSLGLMYLFFTSVEKIIVLVTGALLSAALIYSFISIQKSKHIDKRTKLSSYFIFLVFISMVGKLIFVLIN